MKALLKSIISAVRANIRKRRTCEAIHQAREWTIAKMGRSQRNLNDCKPHHAEIKWIYSGEIQAYERVIRKLNRLEKCYGSHFPGILPKDEKKPITTLP